MKGRVIVIGASHGGVETLSRLIKLLPADFPAPVFVAQQRGGASSRIAPRVVPEQRPF